MSLMFSIIRAFQEYHGKETNVQVSYHPDITPECLMKDTLSSATLLSFFISRTEFKGKVLTEKGDNLTVEWSYDDDPVVQVRELGISVLQALEIRGELSGKTKALPRFLQEALGVGIEFNHGRWSVVYVN